jgi:PAS domain S-box-containing protein
MSQADDKNNVTHRLGERVKELTALHSTAKIFQKQSTVPELLQEVVSILPPAWQYPCVTAARITFHGMDFQTDNFTVTPWRQSADFTTTDGKLGAIEVYYLDEMPQEVEGPFLAEERNLINSLAEMLRIYLDRKLAEEALLESEERFRATFEQAPVGITHVGLDGRFLMANSKFCEIIGYTYEELIGRKFQDVTCVYDVDHEVEYRDKLMMGRVHSYTIEKRNIRRDGSPVWVNQTVSMVRGPTGEAKYLVFVLDDISDRKRAEAERKKLLHDLGERVKELTAMYRAMEIVQQQKPAPGLLQEIVEGLPDAWQYPEITAARIVFEGQEYKTRNYVKTPWSQAAHFRTHDALEGFIEVVYLEEKPEEAEGPFLAEERKLIDSLAKILRSFLNHKMAEEALRESEKLYRTLAEAAHDMVYIIDDRWRIVYFNNYAAELLGENPHEHVGKKACELYPPEEAERHESHERHVWETGEPVYFEDRTTFPSRSLWTATWLVPIKGENGETTSLMGIVRDIDARKRAEEAVLDAEKALARARPGT